MEDTNIINECKKIQYELSKISLWSTVQSFIHKHDITCPEHIYQSDRVIEGAYEFIEDCCEIVGYKDLTD